MKTVPSVYTTLLIKTIDLSHSAQVYKGTVIMKHTVSAG